MAKFLVKGGKALEGNISVSGSKNASLPALAASLLFSPPAGGPAFQNLPEIEDIKRMKELLDSVNGGQFDYEIAKKIRASILAVGPALAHFGKTSFPHPGGCVIGARPIDVFLDGWKAMGANISTSDVHSKLLTSDVHNLTIYEVSAPRGLKGCDFIFRVPSVTGTEGLMMTAILAKGQTVLRNAAEEPEIASLADWLNKNGAEIRGAGTHTITIEGRAGKPLSGQVPFFAPPDRIEAGSLAILGAVAAKEMTIKNFPAEELTALLAVLKAAGVEYEIGNGELALKQSRRYVGRAVNIQTKEYPGFATDLQAPYVVFATQAEGASMIHETIFEGRLSYVEDLNKMGARITLCDPHRAIVHGPSNLAGWNLEGPDIRAGLAFLMAALIANGESQIGNIYQIDRGYEKIDERLRKLGAEIKRVE
ncbi:MAG: UDP-N-acetylglucosamine 1-carboxyvinyltransferase [Candidatus Giovannonibacteria bacterium]|nr:MAG: UDP-N-acetylglucosamine 1-carboxyvinyltransferase [Candidatus Giovannonibacteria bacterium]